MNEQAEIRRGVVEVAGPDAGALLQRLITNDVERLEPGEARYAALLSPQGKIIVDFFVVSVPTTVEPIRFLLDCPAHAAGDLARRLTLYRLRAKVAIADRSEVLAAAPLAAAVEDGSELTIYADPRSSALGWRGIGPRDLLAPLADSPAGYAARRVAAGIPEGGIDFRYNDSFPHEANFDRLQGVDFEKGCYVGQEVVSRMQHRGTARTRVARFTSSGDVAATGETITAGAITIGTVGTVADAAGLALIRIDRLADAQAAGTPVVSSGAPLTFAPTG